MASASYDLVGNIARTICLWRHAKNNLVSGPVRILLAHVAVCLTATSSEALFTLEEAAGTPHDIGYEDLGNYVTQPLADLR